MSKLEFNQVTDFPLFATSMTLEPGLHTLLGAPHDGTHVLLELVTGWRRPQRGAVSLDEHVPSSDPGCRRHIGCAFADEAVFEERTVLSGVEARLLMRRQALDAREVLARYELSRLAERHPKSLGARERHAIALALALCTERPWLIALEEPLAASGVISKVELLRGLRELARTTIVLCVTASPRQAAELGSEVALLDSGQFKRVVMGPTAPGLTPGSQATLSVVSRDVGELAQALCTVSGVSILSVDAASQQLRLKSEDLRRLGREVLRVVVDRRLDLRAMTQELPELGEVRAVNAALSRVAYERAYGTAVGSSAAAQPPAAVLSGVRP